MHSVCRTCIKNLSGLQYNIFHSPDIKNMLILCTSLPVEFGDGFPTSLCRTCFMKLNDFFKFQQMCKCSMQQYNALIAKQTTNQQNTDSEKDKQDEYLISLKEAKQEQKNNLDNLIDPESKREEFPNLKPPLPARLVNQLSSEEQESEDDADNECHETDKINQDVSNGGSIEKELSNQKKVFFSCEVCNRCFQKEILLKAHKKVHKSLKVFPCTQCDKTFTKLYRLRIHIRSIHNRERLPCPEQGCDRTYALQQTLRKHIRDVHKGSGSKPLRLPYICEECGKVLTSLSTFKNHRYLHNGKQLPFECPQCRKRYVTKHKLKEHMNRHAGIKNHVCPQCGVRKTTRSELNAHINCHTKEKVYPCKYCEQVFSRIGNLGRHVRIVHEGIKNFRCKYCEKSFGKADTRKHHEMTHTGEKPHECKICQMKFIQTVSLHKHMKRHKKAP